MWITLLTQDLSILLLPPKRETLCSCLNLGFIELVLKPFLINHSRKIVASLEVYCSADLRARKGVFKVLFISSNNLDLHARAGVQ